MFPEEQIEAWAELLSGNFPDLCTITGSGAESRDAFDDVSTTPTTVAANVKCHYMELTGSEKLVTSGVASVGDFLVQLDRSAAGLIKSKMTIEVAARAPQGAKTFQVKRALESSFGAVIKVLAREIRNG